MNINIYEKYKVKVKHDWCTLSEENLIKYDNIFNKESNKRVLIFNGSELLQMIANNLKKDYFSEFTIVGDEIHFEYFNFNNGENEHICYKIIRGKNEI